MNGNAFWNRLNHLKEYDEKATETAFLLGGIGTGNVSLGARGELKDWELFNGPGKGNTFPYTFFALHADNNKSGGERLCENRVLEGPIQPPHSLSHGYDSARLAGLPRMRRSAMRAEYPLCAVRMEDEALPLEVTLEAYTPFIPLDDEDSALPAAVLRYRVRNTGREPLFVSIAGSMSNMTSFDGYGVFNYVKYKGGCKNSRVEGEGLRGFLCEALTADNGEAVENTMALTSPDENLCVKPNWYLGAWYDSAQDFWDDFSSDGLIREEGGQAAAEGQILFQQGQRIGSVASYATLEAAEERCFTFYLSWHFPSRVRSWSQECCGQKPLTRNYYSLRFENAFAAAAYLHRALPRLERATLSFHEALFESTLPKEVLDAVSSNITVLRSTTCFRIEDGSFFGWEGCFGQSGCCDGTCTHVWNYAQTVAWLFPRLEQNMRRNEFTIETKEDGAMNFRARLKLGDEEWTLAPAIDGQCGSIVRLHREWMLSGDDSLIEEMGPRALLALDYVIARWDPDRTGIPASDRQHNTYDIDFYGVNPLSCGVYLAALKAGEAFARRLHQEEKADAYASLFQKGSQKADELLWNGEYYAQRLENVDEHPYQHGPGCLSDQLLGQFLANMAGLGPILPREHAKKALQSIYRYNFREDLSRHQSVQRCFALGRERGLLLCSWPQGGRPRFPFVYSDEVWSGIEYQVACCLIAEGLVDEGLEIVKAARERQDGYKRNPFNEVECGNHYARSMASWGLIPALSGFAIDRESRKLTLNPRVHQDDFRCFFSTGTVWGVATQTRNLKGETVQQFTTLGTLPEKK